MVNEVPKASRNSGESKLVVMTVNIVLGMNALLDWAESAETPVQSDVGTAVKIE